MKPSHLLAPLFAAVCFVPSAAEAATLIAVSGSNGIGEYLADGSTWTFQRQITSQSTVQMLHQNGTIYATTGSGVISVNVASGAVTTLATRATGNASSWTTGDSQGITAGADGLLYFSTAFGTNGGTGVYRLDITGSTFENFIPLTGTGYNLNNARDLVWNGGELYVSARGAFNATNRPIYAFNTSGQRISDVATGLQAPQPLYLEGSTLYVGSGSGGTQVRTIDLTGTLPSNGSVLFTGGGNILDILRIEGDIYTAHFNTGTGGVGEVRNQGATPVVTGATGVTFNGLAIIPEPSSALLGLSSLFLLLGMRRRNSSRELALGSCPSTRLSP